MADLGARSRIERERRRLAIKHATRVQDLPERLIGHDTIKHKPRRRLDGSL